MNRSHDRTSRARRSAPHAWVLAALLGACAPEAAVPLGEPAAPDTAGSPALHVEPAAPRLARLTRTQVHHVVRDLLGPDVVPPAALEPDTPTAGLVAVGATTATLSPRGVEQSVDAALALAAQALATPSARAKVVPCEPAGPADAACLEQVARTFGRRAWRRPITDDEAATLVAIGQKGGEALGSFDRGAELLVSALLASPHFLYRVELGEEAPDDPAGGPRRYTSWEMASRLSFLIWDTMPDDALLAAAEAGDLVDDAKLAATVDAMIADPRARDGVRAFFGDWLALRELDGLTKDPAVFAHFSADLGAAAAEETLRSVERVVVDRDADVRELFTTRETFVNPRLAAIYGVPAPEEGFALVELPQDGARAGILGQVSFLATNAHPTSSSATKRGVALRQRLLCQVMPTPPAELNTAIPEPSPGLVTLRDRLEEHRKSPECAACHDSMDPPGYGLELFDGLGRHRLTEGGVAIDPSGELDGAAYDGPRGLFEAVADHPDLVPCITKTLYQYATNRAAEPGEQDQLDALAASFEAHGHRFRRLLFDVATSPGFRRVGGQP